MLERVFALAGESAGRAGDEQVLLLEVCEGLAEVEALLGRGGGQCALPEGLPDDGGGLQQAALEPVEGVEPGREQGLNGAGESLRLGGLLLQQTIDHLLGEQGVASRALGDLGDDVGRAVVRPRHQRGDQLSRLVLGQGLERDREGIQLAASPSRPSRASRSPRTLGRWWYPARAGSSANPSTTSGAWRSERRPRRERRQR